MKASLCIPSRNRNTHYLLQVTCNSKALASELQENVEEIIHRYYMLDDILKMFKLTCIHRGTPRRTHTMVFQTLFSNMVQ